MNFLPREEIKPEVNIVTLVDVVLLLLIFFMLTTNFVLQSGIEVKLPQAAPTKVESTKEITITIDRQNRIFLNRDRVSSDDLSSRLEKLLREDEAKKLVIIRADEKVFHGTVVKIMDLSKRLGVEALAIATEAAQ